MRVVAESRGNRRRRIGFHRQHPTPYEAVDDQRPQPLFSPILEEACGVFFVAISFVNVAISVVVFVAISVVVGFGFYNFMVLFWRCCFDFVVVVAL